MLKLIVFCYKLHVRINISKIRYSTKLFEKQNKIDIMNGITLKCNKRNRKSYINVKHNMKEKRPYVF